MKKALKLLTIFFCYSIIGLFLGTFLYSLYENILNYVAGKKFVFFDINILKNSFFYIAGCLILFISSAVAYTRIRYKGGLSQLLVFIFVSAIAWLFCFPLVLKFGNEAISETVYLEQDLSSGYFRAVNDDVYYFLDKDLENSDSVSFVHIDKNQNGKVTVESVKSQNELPLKNAAKPFKEILLSKNIQTEDVLAKLINCRLILQKAEVNLAKGWSFWFGFLSLGLVLCSIYGLSNFFNWKLINACLVMILTLLVLVFNTSFYNGSLDGFKNLGFWKLPFIQSFGKIVDEPVLVIINIFTAVCFIITGIVRFFIARKQNKKGDIN